MVHIPSRAGLPEQRKQLFKQSRERESEGEEKNTNTAGSNLLALTHTPHPITEVFQTGSRAVLGEMGDVKKKIHTHTYIYIPEMLTVRSLRKWICLNRLSWTFIP